VATLLFWPISRFWASCARNRRGCNESKKRSIYAIELLVVIALSRSWPACSAALGKAKEKGVRFIASQSYFANWAWPCKCMG